MSFSTFSGPIRSGTVREGAGRNTGLVNLSQSYDTGDLTGTIVGNVDTASFIIPRGSQIIDIVVDQVVAATAATQLAWQTSTTADTTIYVRVAVATATLTAGRAIVTVVYAQRADNGAQNPASA